MGHGRKVMLLFCMQLITSFPRYHDGEINAALMRELKTGLQLKKETERAREIQAAREAKEKVQSKEMKGLGRCVAVIPEWEFYRMKDKYGHHEIHSKEFMKYYQKTFPNLSPNKL